MGLLVTLVLWYCVPSADLALLVSWLVLLDGC